MDPITMKFLKSHSTLSCFLRRAPRRMYTTKCNCTCLHFFQLTPVILPGCQPSLIPSLHPSRSSRMTKHLSLRGESGMLRLATRTVANLIRPTYAPAAGASRLSQVLFVLARPGSSRHGDDSQGFTGCPLVFTFRAGTPSERDCVCCRALMAA